MLNEKDSREIQKKHKDLGTELCRIYSDIFREARHSLSEDLGIEKGSEDWHVMGHMLRDEFTQGMGLVAYTFARHSKAARNK